MPYNRIWIHCVWSTKHRKPVLTDKIRPILYAHIRNQAMRKGIHLDSIGGYIDHVHVLIALRQDQTVVNIMQLIKGESSYWLNKESMVPGIFGWQEEYFSVSVCDSHVAVVRNYINRQEEHHRSRTFEEEGKAMIKKYGF